MPSRFGVLPIASYAKAGFRSTPGQSLRQADPRRRLLLRSESVTSRPPLLAQVSKLTERCSTALANGARHAVIGDNELARRFQHIAGRFTEVMRYSRRLAERHQILPIGGAAAA